MSLDKTGGVLLAVDDTVAVEFTKTEGDFIVIGEDVFSIVTGDSVVVTVDEGLTTERLSTCETSTKEGWIVETLFKTLKLDTIFYFTSVLVSDDIDDIDGFCVEAVLFIKVALLFVSIVYGIELELREVNGWIVTF